MDISDCIRLLEKMKQEIKDEVFNRALNHDQYMTLMYQYQGLNMAIEAIRNITKTREDMEDRAS